MHARLRPALTLEELFGVERLYCPRPSPNACAWLPRDQAALDMLTGGQLAIAGGARMLCAEAVCSPQALELLREAGFDVPAEPLRYRDADDYLRVLAELAGDSQTVVVNHVHPVGELPAERCWIAPATLSYVNNKANLPALVAPACRPVRRTVPTECLTATARPPSLPVVLKAVTDESTGAGADVLICASAEELERAAAHFALCDQVVVEDFIAIERNLCLNYAVTAEGAISYLGCAEQISDAQGRYQGNWIDALSEPPPAAIQAGFDVARAGFERGYWGFVGLDLAIDAQGRMVVFDLNFRINGSTTALLLAERVRERLGQPVLRLRSWRGQGSYGQLLAATYAAMDKGLLVPLNSYDPAAGGQPLAPPRLLGLLGGGSREEVGERERELAALGLQ